MEELVNIQRMKQNALATFEHHVVSGPAINNPELASLILKASDTYISACQTERMLTLHSQQDALMGQMLERQQWNPSITGTAPREAPAKAWPPGKPPGGEIPETDTEPHTYICPGCDNEFTAGEGADHCGYTPIGDRIENLMNEVADKENEERRRRRRSAAFHSRGPLTSMCYHDQPGADETTTCPCDDSEEDDPMVRLRDDGKVTFSCFCGKKYDTHADAQECMKVHL